MEDWDAGTLAWLKCPLSKCSELSVVKAALSAGWKPELPIPSLGINPSRGQMEVGKNQLCRVTTDLSCGLVRGVFRILSPGLWSGTEGGTAPLNGTPPPLPVGGTSKVPAAAIGRGYSLAPLYTVSSGEATRLARWGCMRNIQDLVLSIWMRDRAQKVGESQRKKGT